MKYGIDISKARTAEEAMELSGLTWVVQEEPLFTGSGRDVASHKALIREDNGMVLGVVGSDYGTLQHSVMFGCMSAIIGSSKATWDEVHCLKGGKRVVLSATMPVTVTPKVGDIVDIKTIISQAFDYSMGYVLEVMAYRLKCSNGMKIGHRTARICIRHTRNAELRIQEALRILNVLPKAVADYSAQVTRLAQKQVDVSMVRKFLDSVVGPVTTENLTTHEVKTSARVQNQRDTITDLFEHGRGNNGETAWDLVNGVTEYINHHRNSGNADSRFNSAMFGSGAAMMDDALEAALAL